MKAERGQGERQKEAQGAGAWDQSSSISLWRAPSIIQSQRDSRSQELGSGTPGSQSDMTPPHPTPTRAGARTSSPRASLRLPTLRFPGNWYSAGSAPSLRPLPALLMQKCWGQTRCGRRGQTALGWPTSNTGKGWGLEVEPYLPVPRIAGGLLSPSLLSTSIWQATGRPVPPCSLRWSCHH